MDEVERLRARVAQLEQSERTLRSIMDAAPGFILSTSVDGQIQYMNRFLPGFTPETVYGTSVFDYSDPAQHEELRATYRRVVETGQPSSVSMVAPGIDGEAHYDTYIGAIKRGDEVVGLMQIALDVTQHREAERLLANREQELTLALEAARIGLWRWVASTEEIHFDDRLARLLGLERGPTSMPEYLEMIHPHDRGRLLERMEDALATGVIERAEYRIIDAHQNERWVVSTGRFISGPPDRVAIGTLVDETDRRRLEEKSRQTSKMEALGRLAGGVAHDFNNLLTVVLGNAQLIVPKDGAHDEELTQIQGAATRAAELTRGLLAFGKKQILEPQTLDLNQLIREMGKLLRRLVPANIALDLELAEYLSSIKADRSQVESVVTNLVINAKDAVGTGPGRILVRTEDVWVGPGEANEWGLDSGDWVRLEVLDDGAGISTGDLVQIFEPFFTTKGNQGTGLGLATVHGIVQQTGGEISVRSRLDQGTRFVLHFPAAGETSSSEFFAEPTPRPVGGGGTVMVVEDDDAVRRVVFLVLQRAGYQVLEANSAEQAREVWSQEGERIALVISDVVMPGEDGVSLAAWLGRQRPEMPVLLMTGYAADANPKLPHNVRRVLQKPVPIKLMSEAVDAVLADE